MYDIIDDIVAHAWISGNNEQQYLYYTACAMVIMLTVVGIDLMYRLFAHFWRA